MTIDNDPTAHAEVNAIRKACKLVNNFNLEGCVIYSSCEPCPMCLSSLYWAGVSRIYYANTQNDADAIDFGDHFIYEEIAKPHLKRLIPCIHVDEPTAILHFKKWDEKRIKSSTNIACRILTIMVAPTRATIIFGNDIHVVLKNAMKFR